MSTTALLAPAVLDRPLRVARPARAPRAPRCAAVRPARVARPARAARPLRLTRRGRLVVTCTAATLLTTAVTTAVIAVGGALTGAAAGTDRAPALTTLTVLPGQTLSQIAGAWAPGEDWREVAGEIVQLNALPSMTLQAGQLLAMPERD